MNLPALKTFLKRAGIQNPLICTSINKDGFRMSGGKHLYEASIADGDCRVIAMQVFSGGASGAASSLEYVCALQGVESILFGASSSQHIEQTVDLIHQFDSRRNKNEQIHHIKAVV
jgi:phosphoribosylformimino-5-aminoimidazole carboxamide ribonucleotide (ProFAR) isomerase